MIVVFVSIFYWKILCSGKAYMKFLPYIDWHSLFIR